MTQLPQATVSDVPSDALHVTEPRGVRDILARLDYNDQGSFNSLYVRVENGEYTDVWATRASRPWLHTTTHQLR